MSFINIQGIDLHYEVYGDSGRPVVLLHGWGQNTEMMAFIGEYLKSHFIVYNLDFPGFGQSKEPPEPWGSEDYCEFLRAFLTEMKVEDPIFIAHSFGCRVALQYAYRYKVHRMVLTGAAGIRDKRGIEYYAKVYSYKLGKTILSLKPFEKYRDSLSKNEDLTDILPYINVETLLVFGEYDEMTPVEKGKQMEKLMPDAALVIFEKDDHFAYINEAARFNLVLDAFLRRDYQ